MSKRNQRLASTAGGVLVSSQSNLGLRPLTEEEIRILERALVKPVDRDYLVHQISRTIGDVVKLSTQPTPRECRDRFLQIVREGRRLLQHIDGCPGGSLLGQSVGLDELTATVSRFCDGVGSVAQQITDSIKPGHPRTPFLLEAFLDNMIGIAKRARVIPSTPSRGERTTQPPPPAFFNFVVAAMTIAKDVIKSSPLSDDRKRASLAVFRTQSTRAFVKVLERSRGRIAVYHDSPYGLLEWNTTAD